MLTLAVMVTTCPLIAGVGLVVTVRVVVVFLAHAAVPVDPNARAPNSTGISRPISTFLEVIWRLKEAIGDCVMSFKAPEVGTVSSQARSLGNKRLPNKESFIAVVLSAHR
jgi:hypothetical protein